MPQKLLARMTDDELREHLRLTCKMLAVKHHRRNNPEATADESHTFAERNWKQFKRAAVDFLALTESDREARSAAPLN